MNMLKPHINAGNVELLYKSFVTSWSEENARLETNRVLRHTNDTLDAIIASNEDLAQGAIRALQSHDIPASEVTIPGIVL